MKSIIVPIDGSRHSLQALRFAIPIAKACGDEIVLLSVHSTSQILGKHLLQEAVSIAQQESVTYRTKVRVGGNPTIEISFEANDPNVRCIVMGYRGSGSNNQPEKKMGSVSGGILQMMPCPVTFVPL